MDSDTISLLQYKLIYTNNTVIIRGTYTIASYDSSLTIIKCASDSLCISGEELEIVLLTNDEIHIGGKVFSIAFA
ncbi:MAG: YabP/YqfC family sporulation protein [Clostridia bacterium]|nr:YabP/YqfC family sporulation protein [Clostridia bacterium]